MEIRTLKVSSSKTGRRLEGHIEVIALHPNQITVIQSKTILTYWLQINPQLNQIQPTVYLSYIQ